MSLVRFPAPLVSEFGNLTGLSLTWRALKPPLACCQLCCPDCCCCWLYEELELCWTDDCRRLRVIVLKMLPSFVVVEKKKKSAMHAFASEIPLPLMVLEVSQSRL